MAHFRIEVKNHGRGMVSKQAYRFGTKEFDNHHQRHFDYRTKGDVVHRDVIMPVNVPGWARSEAEFWRQAEKAANRQDARIAKEFIVSLPRELGEQSYRNVLQDFIDREFTRNGLGTTLAIHNPAASDGSRNPHAHILVSMRPIDADGFAKKKLRTLDRAKGISAIRERWARTLNQEFARQRIPERVIAGKKPSQRRMLNIIERAKTIKTPAKVIAKKPSLQWAGQTPALKRVASQLRFYNQQLNAGRIPNPITNKPAALSLARKLGRETFRDKSQERQDQQREHEQALSLTHDMRR